MSHFSLTRATWVTGTDLLAGEMASLDAKTFAALNGDGGGSYSPSSVITIGGQGLTSKFVGINNIFSGAEFHWKSGSYLFLESGAFLQTDAGSAVTASGQITLSFTSNTDAYGPIHVKSGGSIIAEAGSSTFLNGGTSVGGNIGFLSTVNFGAASNATVDGYLTTNGPLAITGTTVFTTQPLFAAGAVFRNPVVMQSAGRVVKRAPVVIATTGSNITGYGGNNTDTVIVRALTAPASIYVDLGQDGDEFTVISKSSSYTLNVFDSHSGTLVFQLFNAVGGLGITGHRSVKLIQVAGAWEVLSAEPYGAGY